MPVTTKLGKMVTYLEQSKTIKEHLHYTFFSNHFLIVHLSINITVSDIFYDFL